MGKIKVMIEGKEEMRELESYEQPTPEEKAFSPPLPVPRLRKGEHIERDIDGTIYIFKV